MKFASNQVNWGVFFGEEGDWETKVNYKMSFQPHGWR
jgi:hypothetical protein